MLVKPGTEISLKDIDPADTGRYRSADEVEDRLARLLSDIEKRQYMLYAQGRYALLIVLQGMDTSGKDGTIRKVMTGFSPLGVQVWPFKAPNEEERAHDFLWRIHQKVPRHGYVSIFNRSHYEDVLVVRVHNLVPKEEWKARYETINAFERMLVKNQVVILKFFLHISKDEQKRRLQERLNDPKRHWKFSAADIEERKHWADYQKAYEAVFRKCSTEHAPWHIVPADKKWYRNLVVAEAIGKMLNDLELKFPDAQIDASKIILK